MLLPTLVQNTNDSFLSMPFIISLLLIPAINCKQLDINISVGVKQGTQSITQIHSDMDTCTFNKPTPIQR